MALTVVFIGSYRPTVAAEATGTPSNRIAVDGEPQPETPARTQVAPPWWFADGRMSFEHDAHGVARVHYFSPTVAANNPVLLYQRLWEGFRVLVRVDGASYAADLRRARVTPWSISAPVETPAGTFEYRVMAVRDVVLFEVKAPRGCEAPAAVRFTFHEHFVTLCEDTTDFRMSPPTVSANSHRPCRRLLPPSRSCESIATPKA